LIHKYFAAISLATLILVAALAFVNLQGTYSGPPPMLDPDFKLWANSSVGPQLMVWNREYVKGPFDQAIMNETMVDGRDAAQLGIFQSGTGTEVYEGLTQSLDGARLAAFFHSSFEFWIMKEPCHCDGNPFNETAVTLLLEVNDGLHTISFLFSDKYAGTLSLLNNRIEFRPTPSGTWTFQKFNFTEEYEAAHWYLPSSLTFRILFGVGKSAVGWHYAFLNRITVISNSLTASSSLTSNSVLILTTFFRHSE
jgi:hypothetical protein